MEYQMLVSIKLNWIVLILLNDNYNFDFIKLIWQILFGVIHTNFTAIDRLCLSEGRI